MSCRSGNQLCPLDPGPVQVWAWNQARFSLQFAARSEVMIKWADQERRTPLRGLNGGRGGPNELMVMTMTISSSGGRGGMIRRVRIFHLFSADPLRV